MSSSVISAKGLSKAAPAAAFSFSTFDMIRAKTSLSSWEAHRTCGMLDLDKNTVTDTGGATATATFPLTVNWF